MTGPRSPAAATFSDAARRVILRLWQRKSIACLVRTLPLGAALLALLVVLRVLGAKWASGGIAGGVMVLWFVGCLAYAWWRKPKPFGALAFWDQRAGRADAFANAWWFEQQTEHSVGQRIHLQAQTEVLPTALTSLNKDLPLPNMRWLTVAPLLVIALLLIPVTHGLGLFDPPLTTEGRRLAVEEGKRLADKKLDADKMQALTEEEKKDIEKLQQKVQETAKSLEQQEAKTSREVLSELEKRAHDAERLAEKLGAGDAAWASDQMVAEMRKHADTAELGDAVANKNTESTAKEAEKIAKQLSDPQLTSETRDRFAETLKNVEKQAQPEDSKRTVGGHVLDASKDLAQTLPQDAAKEFQSLADQMKVLAQREKAREELEKLAQQLRDSGANIANQGTQGMQQLAGNQPQSGASQNSPAQQMQTMPNAPQMQSMQVPGLSNAPQAQGQQGQQQGMAQNVPMRTPGQEGQSGQPQALVPGKDGKQGNGGQPFLIAPIPGTQPGQQPSVAILGNIPGSSPGGLEPGNGTTGLGNNPTKANSAKQSSTVTAASNPDGESAVRSVEGAVHNESATRATQTNALQAITEEEKALDESALPTARREQVRRYFTELRKRFEKQN